MITSRKIKADLNCVSCLNLTVGSDWLVDVHEFDLLIGCL